MKNSILYLLAGMGFGLLLMFSLTKCEQVNKYGDSLFNPKKEAIHDTIKVIETRIGHRETQVIKWKQRADKIVYIKDFDTITVVDSAKAIAGRNYAVRELIKCDSVVSYWRDTIGAANDSNLSELKKVIVLKDSLCEEDIKDLRKAYRKEKRKAFFRGVGVGAAAVLVAVIAIIAS